MKKVRPDKILPVFVVGLIFALSSCSTSKKLETKEESNYSKPRLPKTGEATDIGSIERWLQAEGNRLIREGKVNFELLALAPPATCKLDVSKASRLRLTAPELYEKAQMSVGIIGTFTIVSNTSLLCMKSSGFFLTASGAFATCFHNLALYGTNYSALAGLVVMTRDGRVSPVRTVLAANITNDVVILQVEGSGFKPLPVTPAAPIGTEVWMISHPRGQFYSLTTGIISQYADWSLLTSDWTTAGRPTWMVVTVDGAPGSSGGPLINEFGAVVGLESKAEGMYVESANALAMVRSLCVPSATLLRLIQKE